MVVAIVLLRGGGGEKANWAPLAESPLSGRFFPATVWTGKEMLVWGGGACSGDQCTSALAAPLSDGAAYDPAAERWRNLPQAPLAARLRPQTVWTGKEMIVWGGNAADAALADGAIYNLETNQWRGMSAAPLTGRFGAAAVWTGQDLLIWGGGEGGQTARINFNDGAAYHPETNSWRKLSPSPLAARSAITGVWTGKEMIVWGGFNGDDSFDDGAAFNPGTNAWRPIAKGPLSARSASANWSGQEVLYWGGGAARQSFNDGAAYNPQTDTWRPLPESPLNPRRAFASAWTGKELLIWGGGPDNSLVFYGSGAAYDPVKDSWRDLPGWNARFGPSSVWTGKQFLVWGGIYAPAKIEVLADGASYAP